MLMETVGKILRIVTFTEKGGYLILGHLPLLLRKYLQLLLLDALPTVRNAAKSLEGFA
jgi:hypothetical protein